MEQEAARAAARRLYQKVSFSGGPLQSYELSSLLADTYDFLKIPFKPTAKDLKGYSQVLDANQDGQVTLPDLEAVAVQFLCGPGVLSPPSFDAPNKKTKYEASSVSTAYASSLIQPPSAPKKQYIPERQQPESSPYNSETLRHLAITRQIFESYADAHFTITAHEVPGVLSRTYEVLGRKGYKPNEEDVKVWMKLCDGNGDGHVEYEEYEYFVVRSLERSGVPVYRA